MKILYISSTMDGIHRKGIYSDLMNEFRDNNHEVFVMYAQEERYKLPTRYFTSNDIKYLGVKTGNITKNRNLIKKGIATLTLDYHFISAYNKHLSDIQFDIVLYSTPPITALKTLNRIKNNCPQAFFYLMLKDIFPQNAVDINMLSDNSLITHYFRRKEKQLYSIFDYIGVMSPANQRYLVNKHPGLKDKVEILPNAIKPLEFTFTKTRKDYDLDEDKTILFYGGNLGYPQGLDFLIECAKKIEELENVILVIAGSGSQQGLVTQYIDSTKSSNIKYMGQLSYEEFFNLTQLIDIGLIFLDNRFTIPNYPQRILSYMEAKKPIILATDPNTDIGTIAEENNYGFSIIDNDSSKWLEKVKFLVDNPMTAKQMGNNGYKYLISNYTVNHSYHVILNSYNKRSSQ